MILAIAVALVVVLLAAAIWDDRRKKRAIKKMKDEGTVGFWR